MIVTLFKVSLISPPVDSLKKIFTLIHVMSETHNLIKTKAHWVLCIRSHELNATKQQLKKNTKHMMTESVSLQIPTKEEYTPTSLVIKTRAQYCGLRSNIINNFGISPHKFIPPQSKKERPNCFYFARYKMFPNLCISFMIIYFGYLCVMFAKFG